MVKQKVAIGVFRHAESKSSLDYELSLLLHKVLATFKSKYRQLFPVLCKTPSFWVKLGSQIFWNIRPWVKGCSAVTRSRIIPIRQAALNFTILLLKKSKQ